MGNLMSDEYSLEYRLKKINDRNYGPKTKYEPKSDAAKNYFEPRTNDPVEYIRFNDEEYAEHKVLINTEGKPMITTHGLYHAYVITGDFPRDDNERPVYVPGDLNTHQNRVVMKIELAIATIFIVSMLLVVLLDNYDWLWLLVVCIIPMAYWTDMWYLFKSGRQDKDWYHVYIAPKDKET